MKLKLGEDSIEFTRPEWERAKRLILETEFQGDETEVAVFTDKEKEETEDSPR